MLKFKKLLFIIGIILSLLIINRTKAATIGDINYLERENRGFYSIQKWNGSEWIYVTYSITHYTDSDGVKRIAYCVDPNLNGIGWIKGEFEGYDVKMKNLLSDSRMWRVYTNGYPYKTAEQLGVETEEDAYLATKQASYCILNSYTINDIRTLYRAGSDKVADENLDDIQRRGNKIIEAICKLTEIGYNGTSTPVYNNILNISKVDELVKEDNEYYSQKYKVDSKVECKNYNVNINNFPKGTIVTDINGKERYEFEELEEFKVLIPKKEINENICGVINITSKCKNYPIYYAECIVGNYQNYMLCCDMYSNDIKADTNLVVNANKCNVEIEKIDKDNHFPISGVKFSVKYKKGSNIGIFITDKDGKINIKNINPGDIEITEVETKENYILNSKCNYLKLEYDESKKIIIENEKKKGAIKIIKVDEDNNELRIKGVKFEIYNINNKCIGELITNEDGEAEINNLPIDSDYIIKEVETAEGYILSDKTITVRLKQNEMETIILKNKKIEKNEEKLPRTGETDINNYLIGTSVIGLVINKKIKKKKE